MANEGFLKILFEENSYDIERTRILPFANSNIYQSTIKQAVKLTEGEDVKNIYDITLDTKDISHNFQPGDTIGILPNNDFEEVNKIFECLDCKHLIDEKCTIVLLDDKKSRFVAHLPVNTNLRDVFSKSIDIRSPPKKTFLKVLLKYTENKEERRVLEQLSSPSNSEDYISFISNNGRTLLGLLRAFPSCKVPIERILENVPPLQPRPYSISSSPIVEHELHIIFSVEYFDEETKGICTGWLEDLISPLLQEYNSNNKSNSIVNFYFRKPNSFRLNVDVSVPIIMIGPGTGIAPFLGFLQHLYLDKRMLNTWLVYGCRYKNKDYLHKNDLEKYHQENYLTKLSIAFSRDEDVKVYIQDLIKNEPAEIYKKLIEENAQVFVCGDIKDMMTSVRNAIKYCLINNGMTINDAELTIADMIKTDKYIEDKWI